MTDRNSRYRDYREQADGAHPPAKELSSALRPNLAKLMDENDRLRAERDSYRAWSWGGWLVVAFAILMLVADAAMGADPLNDALRDAAGHSVTYHGTPLYISLYDIPADKRAQAIDAIAFAAHHMSHSGVPVRPVRVSDICVMLPAEQYDPFNKGWLSAWSKINDPRYSAFAYEYQFVNERLHVSSVVINGDRCSFVCKGHSYANVAAKHLVKCEVRAYGPWIDSAAAQLLYERTGYDMVTASEFVAQACVAPLYYEFTAAPKTLAEFLGIKSHSAFGLAGARGANLDESGVTGTQRGTEAYEDYLLSFDIDKSQLLTPERDVFGLPDRTNKSDAYEAFKIGTGGQAYTFIAGGNQARVENGIVPGQIALDYSHGNRVIYVGLGCWSCHFARAGNAEQGGYIEHQHSNGIPSAKDKIAAAQIGAYYGDQRRRERDGLRHREDWYEASRLACDGAEPSDCVDALNWMFDQVMISPVTPTRACIELCLAVDADSTPEATLTQWLKGVSNDALGQLAKGETVNPQRFRQALPLALSHISYARRFAK
jgi:hypothetical protein